MNSTEKLVDDILNDRIDVKQLDLLQLEAVIDFMRDSLEDIVSSTDDEDEEQYAEGLMTLVEMIEDAAQRKFQEQIGSEWDKLVEESIARGNSYFELEDYVLQ